MTDDERRQFPRFAVNLKVTLETGATVEMASENISLGGLFLVCVEPPCQQGEHVVVHVRLPAPEPGGEPEELDVPCEVMHVVPPLGMGMRFELKDDETRGRLSQYLDRLSQVQAELG